MHDAATSFAIWLSTSLVSKIKKWLPGYNSCSNPNPSAIKARQPVYVTAASFVPWRQDIPQDMRCLYDSVLSYRAHHCCWYI